MLIYCVKCQKKQEAKNTENVTLKSGRNAIRGECSVCGTKVFQIIRKAEGKSSTINEIEKFDEASR